MREHPVLVVPSWTPAEAGQQQPLAVANIRKHSTLVVFRWGLLPQVGPDKPLGGLHWKGSSDTSVQIKAVHDERLS